MNEPTETYIDRDIEPQVVEASGQWPIITITGPRQSGKTTLCKKLFATLPYVTLEDIDVREFARDDPRGFLSTYADGAVFDEIQRVPDLVSYLQEVVDRNPAPGRWILAGSQKLSATDVISQSLVGRSLEFQLLPLSWHEFQRFPDHPRRLDSVLLMGSYPRVFHRDLEVADWYRMYLSNYIERDVRDLLNIHDQSAFSRFVQLCAGRTSRLLNYQSLANDTGVSQPTSKAWLRTLDASYITFNLPPASLANSTKRIRKSPKLHFIDTGLVCRLLGIQTENQLHSHPLRGAIFETWVASEMLKQQINTGKSSHDLHFYRDQNGSEVDLIVQENDRSLFVEIKATETPSKWMIKKPERVRKLYQDANLPGELRIVHGGLTNPGSEKFASWRDVHRLRDGTTQSQVIVEHENQPISGARVFAFFPNRTWKEGVTDENGRVGFEFHRVDLPMLLFVAASEYAAYSVDDWVPSDGDIHATMIPLPSGGSQIYESSWISPPTLHGEVNLRPDPTRKLVVLNTRNIAVDGQADTLVNTAIQSEFKLEDADGNMLFVKFVDITSRCLLVEYSSRPT